MFCTEFMKLSSVVIQLNNIIKLIKHPVYVLFEYEQITTHTQLT